MDHIWLTYKIMEAAIGSVCVAIHLRAFLVVGVTLEHYFYCAVFFSFTLVSMFGAMNIAFGKRTRPIMEISFNMFAAISFIGVSLLGMYTSEKDFYLVYLADRFEEPLRPHFEYSKAQAICALAGGCIYMLHTILAFDAMLNPVTAEMDDEDEGGTQAKGPLRLYFCGKKAQKHLERYRWFRQILQKTEPNRAMA